MWRGGEYEEVSMTTSQVFVELRSSRDGCYAKATIEGAPDGLPCTFLGAFGSRDEAVRQSTGWALGWLRRLRQEHSLR
jgi:hypothetical protein